MRMLWYVAADDVIYTVIFTADIAVYYLQNFSVTNGGLANVWL